MGRDYRLGYETGAADVELARDRVVFFSSRRRHTRYIGDWSSDVCSSDLKKERVVTCIHETEQAKTDHAGRVLDPRNLGHDLLNSPRNLVRALEGGCVGKLEIEINVALVLIDRKSVV